MAQAPFEWHTPACSPWSVGAPGAATPAATGVMVNQRRKVCPWILQTNCPIARKESPICWRRSATASRSSSCQGRHTAGRPGPASLRRHLGGRRTSARRVQPLAAGVAGHDRRAGGRRCLVRLASWSCCLSRRSRSRCGKPQRKQVQRSAGTAPGSDCPASSASSSCSAGVCGIDHRPHPEVGADSLVVPRGQIFASPASSWLSLIR